MAILAFSSNNIFDSTSAGRALLTAADASAQRTLLGLSSSSAVSFQSLVLSGQSLTGSTATSVFDASTTWNTTGTPVAWKLNVTDTASGGNPLLIDLQANSSSRFDVTAKVAATYIGQFSHNGLPRVRFSAQSSGAAIEIFAGSSNSFIGFGTIGSTVSRLYAEDASNGIIGQRNGVNPQTFRVYNTFTDISNYERAKIAWSSNVLQIGTEKLGTGVARALALQTDGTTRVTVSSIYPQISLGTDAGATILFSFSGNSFTSQGNGRGFSIFSSANTAGDVAIALTGDTVFGPTTGVYYHTYVYRLFAPTSGTTAFDLMRLTASINQTGGANGITRGLYVAPTLTAAADWRSIETSNNTGYAFYGAGTAPSYFGGNVGIGVAPSSFKLHIRHTGGDFIRLGISAANADTLDGGISWYTNEAVTADYFGGLRLRFQGGSGANNRQMQFLVGDLATPKVVITGQGFVGVGTNTPDRLFIVTGSNATGLEGALFYNSNTTSGTEVAVRLGVFNGANGLAFRQSTNATGPVAWASGSYDSFIQAGQSGSKLHFAAGGNTSPQVTLSGGNLGIGTTSPKAKIHTTDALIAKSFLGGSYYHYSNGILIRTDIAVSDNRMFELTIEGNSYNDTKGPIFARVQAYNFITYGTIITTSAFSTDPNFTIDVFHYDGFVYFWFAQTGSFQTYTLKLISPMADHVISQVSNAAKPVSGVTNSVTITPAKLWNSLNDGAGSGLDADTLDGQQLSSIVSGTTNYVSKFTGANAIGNSQIFDNGTGVGIGTTSPSEKLHVFGNGYFVGYVGINQTPSTFYDIITSGAIRSNTAYIAASNTGYYALGSGSDVYLTRDAAGSLAQRNGVNAQTFNIYNTYTDASNYERGFVKWSGNTLQIGNEAAGTGSQRNLQFWTGGSARITVDTIGRVGIANATPAVSLHIGAGANLSIPDGAGSTITPQVLHTDTSGKVAIACGVNDGTNNRRIGLFLNQTDSICGIGATWSTGNIPFVITLAGLERLRIDTGGNVGIGTTSPSARLHVKGSGTTFATFGINLEDSAGTHVFRVRDDGGIHIGPTTAATNGAFISASDGTDNNGTTTGSGLRYRSSLTISSTGSDHLFRNYQGSRTGTSGTSNLMEMNGGFAPTSGTGVYNFVRVVGTINQTGGSTGITRGIWVSPTLTAAADFRAIETENGSWRLNDTYASGSGSLAGSALVINQTWNTTGTPTAVKLNVTDTASNANSLLLDLQVGSVSMFKVAKTGRTDINGTLSTGGFNIFCGALMATSFIGVDSSGDTKFHRDAAGIFAQRNGVNAQALRVYNTYTDASNYERAKIAWESNILRIGTENAGTGSARAFELQTNGLTQFTIAANGIITTTNGFNVGSSSNSITNASANGTGTERVFACSQAYAATAGSRIIFSSTNSVQPTSGTLTYTGVGISPTINQTGGANGITRGIHINPTLTAAADWRAIEITAGKTIVAPSTTTSASLNIPSGTAPTSPVDGDIWFDGTALKIRIGGVTKTVTVT